MGDDIEILFFGPGYGESILIHFGNDEWMIVDSCRFRNIKEPAPIYYLKKIGKDPAQCVKVIVATHWDDDHIKGLSDVVLSCPFARVFISSALKNRKFTTLIIDFPLNKIENQKTPSGLKEFNKIYYTLRDRDQPLYLLSSSKSPPNKIVTPFILTHKTIEIAFGVGGLIIPFDLLPFKTSSKIDFIEPSKTSSLGDND